MSRRPPRTHKRNRSLPAAIRAAAGSRPERNRKKLDLFAVVRVALLLALAGQTLRVMFTSPRFRLSEVYVSGTARYTPADMVRLARVPVGENLFRVNLGGVSERLQQEPALDHVMVTRELPDALRIEVKERVPAIQVTAGPAAFHADRNGTIFETAPPVGAALPVLELPAAELPPLGRVLRTELVNTVWECVRLARREKLALGKMRVDDAGELWLNIQTVPSSQPTQGGLAVRVGRSTELPEKFRDIRQCLAGWPQLTATAAYLNVMSAGNPARMELTDEKRSALSVQR